MPGLREFSKYVQKDRFARSFDRREHNLRPKFSPTCGFSYEKIRRLAAIVLYFLNAVTGGLL